MPLTLQEFKKLRDEIKAEIIVEITGLKANQLPKVSSVTKDHLFIVADKINGTAYQATEQQVKDAIAIEADFKSCKPSTVPTGADDGDVYWPETSGTYTNFLDQGGAPLTVSTTDVVVYFIYNGTYYTKRASTIDLTNYYSKAQIDQLIGAYEIPYMQEIYRETIIRDSNAITLITPYSSEHYTQATFARNIGALSLVHKAPEAVRISGIRAYLYADSNTQGQIKIYRSTVAPTPGVDVQPDTAYTLIKTFTINNNYATAQEYDFLFDADITLLKNEFIYLFAQSFNSTLLHSLQVPSTQTSFVNLFPYNFVTAPGASWTVAWRTAGDTVARTQPVKYLKKGAYTSKENNLFPTKPEFNNLKDEVSGAVDLYDATTKPGKTISLAKPYSPDYYIGTSMRSYYCLSQTHLFPAAVTIKGIRAVIYAAASMTGEARIYKSPVFWDGVNTSTLTFIKKYTVSGNYTEHENDFVFDAPLSFNSGEYLILLVVSFNSAIWTAKQLLAAQVPSASALQWFYKGGASPSVWPDTAWSVSQSTTSKSQPFEYITEEYDFEAKPNDFFVTKKEYNAEGNGGSLSFSNSDTIVHTGCSYTAGAGTSVANKAYICLLSLFTNYIIHNFAQSGSKTVDITDRIRRNTPSTFTTTGKGARDVKPVYITVNNIGNETLNYQGVYSQLYTEEIKELLYAIQSIQAFAIFSTDWMIRNTELNAVLKSIADRSGSWFHDAGNMGDKLMTIGVPAIRWSGTHPDSRGQAHSFNEYKYFLDRLPKPEKSIKAFRKRGIFVAASIQSFNYDSINQRAVIYKEIGVGHDSLPDIALMDISKNAATKTNNKDEYINLKNGVAVQFDEVALFEITLEKVNNKTITINVFTDQNSALKLYLKNNLNPSTYAPSVHGGTLYIICNVSKALYDSAVINSGDQYSSTQVTDGTNPLPLVAKGKYYSPDTGYIIGLVTLNNVEPVSKVMDAPGSLTRISGSGTSSIAYNKIDSNLSNHSFEFLSTAGKAEGSFDDATAKASYTGGTYILALGESDIQLYVKYDNIKLLLNLPGQTFNILNVVVEYTGGSNKRQEKTWYTPKLSFPEKISDNTFDPGFADSGRWINTDGITGWAMSAPHQDYPTILYNAQSSPSHYHVVLDYGTDYTPKILKRVISIQPRAGYRKCVIKVICRLFPKLLRTDLAESNEVTHTQQVTTESYDFGNLCAGIKGNNITNVLKSLVAIGWMEAYFEFDISPYQSSFELQLFRDFADVIDPINYKNHSFEMHLWSVSCQVEGE